MHMGYELQQNQKLTQKLSHKMVQAINVLQMTTEALDHYMMESYVNNPVLDIQHKDHLPDWDRYSLHNKTKTYLKDDNNWDDKKDDRKIASVKAHTAVEDLLIQWHAKKLHKDIEYIGERLIAYINNKGYLDIEPDEFSEQYQVSVDKLKETIEKVQELEPAGIGSFNLSQRLLIQLRRHHWSTPILEKLVVDYLDELGHKKWHLVCKKLGITMEQLKACMNIIQKLNPIIHVEDNPVETLYIKPQVKIVTIHGQLKVEYIEDHTLTLFIPSYYQGLIIDSQIDDATKTYLKHHMDNAAWLFRNIEERKQNIIKIASCILEKQMDFIKYGEVYMRRMTQKEVADALDLSISTVSRIVNGKYMETPRGMYEMKYFFSSGIEGNQDELSAIAVKSKISELIEEEDKRRPLSDEKIKSCLKKWDIHISRRTVAKYRMSLGLLNASKRKEL